MILEGTTSDYPEPSIVGSLRGMLSTARSAVRGLPVTGWRWKRPPRECPPWCARDHRCTVRPVYGLGRDGTGYQLPGPLSEHRSPTASWSRPYGRMVATRVQPLDPRRDHLELTVRVALSGASERLALAQTANLPFAIDHAIQVTLEELEIEARIRALQARKRQLEASRPYRVPVFDQAPPATEPVVEDGYLPWGSW